MVGNTYPYTTEDWVEDIKLARAHGLDGFALNVGREEWQRCRVEDCYTAAARLNQSTTGPDVFQFKLFISFDMTSIPSATEQDTRLLCDYMQLCKLHIGTCQLIHKDRVLVSTFAGEMATFGRSNGEGWVWAKQQMEEIAPISFIPAFFIDPARYPNLDSIDGIFHWNGSWPIGLTPSSPRSEIVCPKLDSDQHHIRCLNPKHTSDRRGSRKTYMAAVSPWFFTHYGADSWNKNWIYRGDDWLLARRWEYIMSIRDEVDIIQIISWNDYGESHYIGPIKGAQPNSEAWVNGFPHLPWLKLNAHFARGFREGRMVVDTDEIYVWARPHLRDAVASDPVDRPKGWELTDDRFWVAILATAPSTVVLSTSAECSQQTRVQVSAGLSKLSHRLIVGEGVKVRVYRDSDRTIVADCSPSLEEFCVQERPEVYNFNAFVAMSS
ncbi:glycoside hydrolase family 71 protein [Heterobasidion irregulare TC 32-1]|uniref:Glycoside hydrolase family 71 protein n=1 Tax=Heterobasidion irregulare (strain TC 32-1) TaxID=747525 RepID=W4JZ45_HETIT|nr:glycoside hydrolase family 71 protein [Heterobasidion irregulare TC 32-1]ETW78345.1 glycoside hydrolase family 71 protein [Heterobasidion irregulare TC 32-1]